MTTRVATAVLIAAVIGGRSMDFRSNRGGILRPFSRKHLRVHLDWLGV